MLVTGHTIAACWGNSSRVASYCETSVLPSGKSNISLVCQQDRYFPNRLWEAAAQLFLPWDHEQGCPHVFGVVQIRRRKGQQVCGQPESLCRSRDAQAAPWCCTRCGLSVLESPHSRGKEPNSYIVGFYTA